jgi:hypothetical protein
MPIKIKKKKVSYKLITRYEFRYFVTFSVFILIDMSSIILRNWYRTAASFFARKWTLEEKLLDIGLCE